MIVPTTNNIRHVSFDVPLLRPEDSTRKLYWVPSRTLVSGLADSKHHVWSLLPGEAIVLILFLKLLSEQLQTFFQHPCLAANWSSPLTSSPTWTTPKQFESKLELDTGRSWHTLQEGFDTAENFHFSSPALPNGDSGPSLVLPQNSSLRPDKDTESRLFWCPRKDKYTSPPLSTPQ